MRWAFLRLEPWQGVAAKLARAQRKPDNGQGLTTDKFE